MPSILVLAKNTKLRERLRRHLARIADVSAAGSSRQALNWMFTHERHFDVLVVDEELTDANGPEFIDFVRCVGVCDDLPIVILTQASTAAELSRAMRGGATTSLRKPIRYDQLESCVETLAEGELMRG